MILPQDGPLFPFDQIRQRDCRHERHPIDDQRAIQNDEPTRRSHPHRSRFLSHQRPKRWDQPFQLLITFQLLTKPQRCANGPLRIGGRKHGTHNRQISRARQRVGRLRKRRSQSRHRSNHLGRRRQPDRLPQQRGGGRHRPALGKQQARSAPGPGTRASGRLCAVQSGHGELR